MGIGAMIGAGIVALYWQIAELAGPLFPPPFVVGTIGAALSAYTHFKMPDAYSSASGIGLILKFTCEPTIVALDAAAAALLMAPSTVSNECLVARTIETCMPRAFGGDPDSVICRSSGFG